MSQTETLLVLALGSALTLLIFLLFGRVFWNMAMAAAARRRAKQVPVEMMNLQADRDRLRAEHALMARKLELRLDDINIRMTEQMAEVSRHRNRVQGLMQEIESRDDALKHRQREIDALTTQLEIKDAEYDAAQRTIEGLNDEKAIHGQEMAKLQGALYKLGAVLRNKDTLVGQLNDELRSLLALPTSEAPADLAPTVEDRLRRRVAELTSISADISRGSAGDDTAQPAPDETTPEIVTEATMAPRGREEHIQEKLAEAERQTEEMQRELRALDELLAQTGSAESPAEPAKKQGAMANVVSLAQRIRALQKGMDD